MSKKKMTDDELELLNDETLQEDTPSPEMDEEQPDETAEDEETEESEKPANGRRRRFVTSMLNNEGENNVTNVKDLFKSINFNGEWFRHNMLFIAIVTVCLLIFVTNRYQAQQEQIEEARLKQELAEMRYKWLTRFSELTTSTRQSQIEDRLRQNGDTTLTHSKDAPFIIRANK